MANKVRAQVAGGSEQTLDGVSTLGDVKKKLGAEGYQATINGEPEDDDSAQLEDYQYVALAKPVKAGC